MHHNHKSTKNENNNRREELVTPSLAPSASPLNLCISVPFGPEAKFAVTEGPKASVLVPMITSLAFGASDIVVPETVIAPPGVRV